MTIKNTKAMPVCWTCERGAEHEPKNCRNALGLSRPSVRPRVNEVEIMRLFIAEALLCLSSVKSRSNPAHLDDLAAKANCFMTGREACEIIQVHDRKGGN